MNLSHPPNQIINIPNVIANLKECDSGNIRACSVTMMCTDSLFWAHRFFFRNCFQGPFSDMVLLLASFFSTLMLPYWFHRLINVKHQKLVSLIMFGKGFKKSEICASERRLYQQVAVTASQKKKTILIRNQYT